MSSSQLGPILAEKLYLFAKCRSVFSRARIPPLIEPSLYRQKREEKEGRGGDTLEMGTICRVGGGEGEEKGGERKVCRSKWWEGA